MNEFEDKLVQSVMQGLHDFEVKMAGTVAEIRGDVKALTDAVRDSILVDTKRLDKHSDELDDQRDRIVSLEEWREGREKQQEQETTKSTQRIAIGNTIAIIIAVVLAYILQKVG